MVTTFVTRLDDNKNRNWVLLVAKSNIGYQYKVFISIAKAPIAEGWVAKFEQSKSIDFLEIFMKLFNSAPVYLHDKDVIQELEKNDEDPKKLLKFDEILELFGNRYQQTKIIDKSEKVSTNKVKYIEDDDKDEDYIEKGSYNEILDFSLKTFCDWCRKPEANLKQSVHGDNFLVCSEGCYKSMEMLFDTKYEKIKKSTKD